MFNKNVIATGMLLLAAAGQAYAKPAIKIDMTVEKDAKVVVDGKTVVKRVPAADTQPGDVLTYTLHYSNSGDELARDVDAKDPIPTGMSYIDKSAVGVGSDISFSVDGKSFKSADQLMVDKVVDGKAGPVKAAASDYKAIKWVIKEVKPGESGVLSFQAIVE